MTSIQASIDSSGAKVGRDEFVRNLQSMQDRALNAVSVFLLLDQSIAGFGRSLSSQSNAIAQSAQAFGQQNNSLAASRGSAEELSSALRDLTQAQSRQGQSSQRSASEQATLQRAFQGSSETARLLGQALVGSRGNLKETIRALNQTSSALERVRQDYGATESRIEQLERVVNGLRGSFRQQRDELIQTRGRLSNLNREFTEARAAQERYQKELQQTSARTREVGTASSAAIRGLGPFVGLISGVTIARGGISSLRSFSQVTAEVGAVSGATSQELQALRQAALDASGELNTEFGATQAGEALLFLSRAGFQAKDSLVALPTTLDIATAGALDLGRAADIVSNALTQFNGQASELSRFGDAIVGAANRSNTSVEQLGTALSSSGTVANAFGVTIESTAASIGVLGNAGIQGSRAGTVLNNVLRGLSAETPKLAGALDDLGLSFEDVDISSVGLEGALEALGRSGNFSAQAAQEIAGRWGQAGLIALVNARDTVADLTRELENNTGETERTAEAVRGNLNASFDGAFNSASNLAIALGDAGLGQALDGVLSGFTASAGAGAQFLGVVGQSETAVQGASVAFTGLGLAVGTAGLGQALTFATKQTKLFTAAINRNPILLATTAVVGLGGALFALTQDAKVARDGIQDLVGDIDALALLSRQLQTSDARFSIAIDRGDIDEAARQLESDIRSLREIAGRVSNDGSGLIQVGDFSDSTPQLQQAFDQLERETVEGFGALIQAASRQGGNLGSEFILQLGRSLNQLDGRIQLPALDAFFEDLGSTLEARLPFQADRAGIAENLERFRQAVTGEIQLTASELVSLSQELAGPIQALQSRLGDNGEIDQSVFALATALDEARQALASGQPADVELVTIRADEFLSQLEGAENLVRNRLEALGEDVDVGAPSLGFVQAFERLGGLVSRAFYGGIAAEAEQASAQRDALQGLVEQLEFEAAQAGRTAEEQERLAVAREVAAQGTRLQADELDAFTQAALASVSVRNALSATVESEANATALLAAQQRELTTLQEQLAFAGLSPADREERRIQLEREAAVSEVLAQKTALLAQQKAILAATDGDLTQAQQEALTAIQVQIAALDNQAATAGATAAEIAKLEIELEKVSGQQPGGLDDFTVSSRQAGSAVVDLIGRVDEADEVIRNFFQNLAQQAASNLFSNFFDGLFQFPTGGGSSGSPGVGSAGGNGGPSDLGGTGGSGGAGGAGSTGNSTALSSTADAIREAVADSLDDFSTSGTGASQGGLLGSEGLKAIKQLTTAVNSLERTAIDSGGVSVAVESSAVSPSGTRSRRSSLQNRRRQAPGGF